MTLKELDALLNGEDIYVRDNKYISNVEKYHPFADWFNHDAIITHLEIDWENQKIIVDIKEDK